MTILGIHSGHDSCAAIVQNGKIVADVQEERFSRVKHSANVPLKSIKYCLDEGGISINDLDYIAFSQAHAPKRLKCILGLENTKSKERIKQTLKQYLGLDRIGVPIYFPDLTLKDTSKFVTVEHHLAHAASAYFTQKSFDECLIFTIDGVGDNVTTAVWLAKKNEIKPLIKYGKEAAIGHAYSIVTEGLHWIQGDGEGKTMGLAPYGNYGLCKGALDHIFPVFEGSELIKKAQMGNTFYWDESGSIQYHMKEAKEVELLTKKFGREAISAEAQRKLEENVMSLIFGWCKKTGVKNIACAGGVFLNVKLNQRIWNNRDNIIVNQHIYPNPGDSGLAVGAALNTYYKFNTFSGNYIDNLYKGPSFENGEIEEILNLRKLNYEFVENPSEKAAELLSENKIVAWFQGRMESGPRALGNRSILMSPIFGKNKDTINANVKFREGFRPFCPSILYEKRDVYLKDVRDEFFMVTSFDVKEEKKNCIPAVVHVDGTGRPQLVSKSQNPRYWELINKFGELTGEYAILNTSFNVMGEPIINNPKEAIRGFFDSGIDALFMNNYYLKK